MSDTDSRNIALTVLTAVFDKQAFLHLAMREALEAHPDLSERDRKFAEYLIRGTVRQKISLDYVLEQFSSKPVRKIKPLIRNILRMGVFQILYMDSVPDRAVCSESVRLAKRRGLSGLSGFVNAVLRTLIREKDAIRWPDRTSAPAEYLSVIYSMPEWLVKKWISELGEHDCERLLNAFQAERAITVRPNPEKTDACTLQLLLEEEGVAVKRREDPPYALDITNVSGLSELKAFRDGLFYVQDAASMLVAEYAAPKEGNLVIDVCGAPGGKSIQIAQMLKGSGQVITRDLSGQKIRLIRQNIERMKLQNMKAEVWDATIPDPALAGQADVVIADLPCSGLGVAGRKPDIRYRISPEDILSLAELQRQILAVVSEYVRPGGVLLYSTCTITPEENRKNAEWFTDQRKDFRFITDRQCMPWEHTDGFYIAKWERI